MRPGWERLLGAARPVRGPAVTVVVYLGSRAIFVALTEGDGLLTPAGSVSVGIAMLGALVLALRLVVLFVLPAVVAYRVVARLLRRPGALVPEERPR